MTMKRRKPIARKTPLSRGPGPKRTTRIRPYNPERRARLQARQYGARVTWLHTLPCCICFAPPKSEASHVRSRGAGGGKADQVPMCRRCHQELHDVGIVTFADRHNVVLSVLAQMYDRFYERAIAPWWRAGCAQ